MTTDRVRLWTESWAKRNQLLVESFSTLESTSTYAKTTALKSAQPFRLILAGVQTQGRGRGQNQWLNSDGLLSTWCFQTQASPQPVLTPLLGLALYKAVQTFSPSLPWSLKAPNDLFLDGKKMAGLLVEVIEQKPHTEILLGLGLNIFSSPDLKTSCHLEQKLEAFLIERHWEPFLTRLYSELNNCIRQNPMEIAPKEAEEICTALNQNPHLSQPYTRLEADGTLWQSEKRIHWLEL